MQQRVTRGVAILMCATALALAGCGSISTASTTIGAQVTPSTSFNGCPTKHIPVDGPPKADVVLTKGGSEQTPTPATITVGQVLRVQLPAAIQWQLTQSDGGSSLQSIDPFGYFHSPDLSCIWNFIAQTPGTIHLAYSGGLLCAPGSACPAIAAIADFTITVQ